MPFLTRTVTTENDALADGQEWDPEAYSRG